MEAADDVGHLTSSSFYLILFLSCLHRHRLHHHHQPDSCTVQDEDTGEEGEKTIEKKEIIKQLIVDVVLLSITNQNRRKMSAAESWAESGSDAGKVNASTRRQPRCCAAHRHTSVWAIWLAGVILSDITQK